MCTLSRKSITEISIKTGYNYVAVKDILGVYFKLANELNNKTNGETYIMDFTCSNCGTKFRCDVPRGTRAENYCAEKCPYCGVGIDNDDHPFKYCKPISGRGRR